MPIATARICRLTHPGEFQIVTQDVKECPPGQVMVRPTVGSICAADLRYYLGRRRPEALRKKLPMALLHEAIGVVEHSNAPGFAPGDRVVLVPNIPGYIHSPDQFSGPEGCCPACATAAIGENYCANSHFLSSGFDGFTRSHVVHPAECLARIPDNVPDDVAVLSELATVSLCAVLKTLDLGLAYGWPTLAQQVEREAAAAREGRSTGLSVGVWGDGPVGYSVAVWLSFLGVSPERLVVFGTSPAKLAHFDFSTTVDIGDLANDPGGHPWSRQFSAAFECVGGEMQSVAANDAIDCLQPGGRLGLVGVNEGLTPLNVRDVLEKGLTMVGCSRSPRQAYPVVLDLFSRSPVLRERFERLGLPPLSASGVEGLQEAFHFASGKAEWGKVIVNLEL